MVIVVDHACILAGRAVARQSGELSLAAAAQRKPGEQEQQSNGSSLWAKGRPCADMSAVKLTSTARRNQVQSGQIQCHPAMRGKRVARFWEFRFSPDKRQ